MSRVKQAELSAERFSHLAWVGRDVWRLWSYRNEHLHQEVAGRNICGIERADESNLMFRIGGVKPKLFMELADGRLLRGFAAFELTPW